MNCLQPASQGLLSWPELKGSFAIHAMQMNLVCDGYGVNSRLLWVVSVATGTLGTEMIGAGKVYCARCASLSLTFCSLLF